MSHNETVTVVVGPEDTMEGAFAQLTSDPENGIANYYWVAVERTLWHVWDTAAGPGEEWRLYLLKVQA